MHRKTENKLEVQRTNLKSNEIHNKNLFPTVKTLSSLKNVKNNCPIIIYFYLQNGDAAIINIIYLLLTFVLTFYSDCIYQSEKYYDLLCLELWFR